MNAKLQNIIKYAVSLSIAVVLLWFSFRGVKWADFIDGLKQCRWVYIALSMLAGLVAFICRSFRWRMLLLPLDDKTKKKTTFNAINISYLANMVLPRIGEFVRCGVITADSSLDENGKRKASYDKVLGTVVVDRSCDVLSLLTLLVLFLLLGWNRFGGFFVEKIWNPLSDKLSFSLWWILVGLAAAGVAGLYALYKFRNSSGVLGKIWGFISGIWNGFISCLKIKKAWLFFVYTAVIWIMYWCMSYFVLQAVRPIAPEMLANLGAVDALFLMLAGSLSSFVPVPGGFGAFHYVVALAISTVYGIPFSVGVIFATLSHESQALLQVICGLVSYASESIRKRR